MTGSKTKLRFVAMMLVACALIAFIGSFSSYSAVKADELSDLEKQITNLKNENAQLSKSINNAASKAKNEEAIQADLKQQISNTQQQISLLNTKISKMEENIVVTSGAIDAKTQEIWENEELFAQRVRAMYISNSTSTLATILGAKSFSDFLTRTEMLKRISESDQELIDTLEDQNNDLNAIKLQLEEENRLLNVDKEGLKQTTESLATLKAKSEDAEAAAVAEQKKYMDKKSANAQKIKEQEAEVDRIIAERIAQGTAAPGEGTYKWPVPSSARITSPYGYRTYAGKKEMHWGVDIGAKAGQDIVAANSGTVIFVKKQNYGYGWHLAIDHGGGHVTLYAHCSSINVKEGDVVERGQKIAGIGTTGDSTGNHLHFEVRVNGAKKQPMNYIKKPA